MTAQRDLFSMNAHGDIWQEPELFDAPAEPWTVSSRPPAHNLEEWRQCEQGGGITLTAICLACPSSVSDPDAPGRAYVGRGPDVAGAWREIYRQHDQQTERDRA